MPCEMFPCMVRNILFGVFVLFFPVMAEFVLDKKRCFKGHGGCTRFNFFVKKTGGGEDYVRHEAKTRRGEMRRKAKGSRGRD